MLALKQATSMSVLARVTVNILAKRYQIVPSIIFRVTVIAHAITVIILLSVVVRVLVVLFVIIWKTPPSEKDRVTTATAIVVPVQKM